jgi:hypothetical protein
MRRIGSVLAFGLIAMWARAAGANTEIDAYDARSLGMSGAGMVVNGAALFQNPAAMDATEHLAATGIVAPLVAWGRAPLTGNYVSSSTGPVAAPLFLLGANVRLTDRIVIGAAAFPTAAYGASFPQKGTSNAEVSGASYAAALGASFAILPNLALGAALNAGWLSEHLENYEGTTGDVSGHTFLGGQLGIYWHPLPNLRFGLAWRAKEVTQLSGSATLAGTPVTLSTQAATPHSFKAGTELGLLDERLTLGVELAYWMYADAASTEPLTVSVNGQAFRPLTTVYDWNDSYAGAVGGELWITRQVPVRAGALCDPVREAQRVRSSAGLGHLASRGDGSAPGSLGSRSRRGLRVRRRARRSTRTRPTHRVRTGVSPLRGDVRVDARHHVAGGHVSILSEGARRA